MSFAGFTQTSIQYQDAEGAPEGSADVVLPTSALLQRKAEAMREQVYRTREAAGWAKGDALPVHITEFRNDGSTPIVPGTTIVMPDHEQNQREEAPFLLYDWRPGYPPLSMVTSAAYRYQDTVTHLEEARHYDDPYQEWFDTVCPPHLLMEKANDYIERAISKARGRSVFAFRKRDGLADPEGWIH